MKGIWQILLVGALALTLSNCGFEVVDPGYRGVKVNLGEVTGEPLAEGLHFYNPFTSDITEVRVKESQYNVHTESFTKDNQAVNVDVTLIWSIDPKFVTALYKEVGREDQIESVRVVNNFMGALKDAIGKQDLSMIVQNRDKAADAALKEFRKKAEPLGILGHTVNFSNLTPNKEYQAAVEAKMTAVQHAEKAVNDTRRIEEEAKQTIKTAEAEARSMEIKSRALSQNKGLIAFEWVKKWDGRQPQFVMGGGSIPMLNMGDLIKAKE